MGRIVVSGVGKAYKHFNTRWSRLAEWMLPFAGARHHLTWVLRDIDFAVEPGEAMGIVGVNGAGKSTLLKIITGTTQPTTGGVTVSGRVAALLELGMGFHPDFTGRQNALMAGQLLGFEQDQILRLMPHIEAFADIGEYLDQPLRIYSSGMQVRLAFAVATAARPDILVVDEALAVGDAAFQRKCFRRIEDFRSEGTTLLFVSHDTETVKRLCDRAAFIHQGSIRTLGKAKSVCDEYERTLFGAPRRATIRPKSDSGESTGQIDPSLDASSIEKQFGDGGADITSVRILNSEGQAANVLPEGEPFSVAYHVKIMNAARGVNFGMMVKLVNGVCVFGANTNKSGLRDCFESGEELSIRFLLQGNLVSGTYYLNVGASHISENGETSFLHRKMDCLIFRISSNGESEFGGCANLFAAPELDVLCESERSTG